MESQIQRSETQWSPLNEAVTKAEQEMITRTQREEARLHAQQSELSVLSFDRTLDDAERDECDNVRKNITHQLAAVEPQTENEHMDWKRDLTALTTDSENHLKFTNLSKEGNPLSAAENALPTKLQTAIDEGASFENTLAVAIVANLTFVDVDYDVKEDEKEQGHELWTPTNWDDENLYCPLPLLATRDASFEQEMWQRRAGLTTTIQSHVSALHMEGKCFIADFFNLLTQLCSMCTLYTV